MTPQFPAKEVQARAHGSHGGSGALLPPCFGKDAGNGRNFAAPHVRLTRGWS